MTKERYDWIMKYHFDSDYPSEQMWHAAFKKFIAELAAYDAYHLMLKVGSKL